MSTLGILEQIHGHADLVGLSQEEQTLLCKEIREFLISRVAKTGGHLASNLGVVELTVAIETVFNTNQDRLVFDVGHQSYVHKLLTNRQADFDYLRQFGGIAGFPKPSESETDAFVAGHASSSVSIALGMARARTLLGQDYHVIALLGDGAATGGMVYEGLNDTADSAEPMVIILNDNEMSIDRNVGGLAKHLSRMRTKRRYLDTKASFQGFMEKLPFGKPINCFVRKVKNRIKRFLLGETIFENMGLHYLGPVNGHDLPELIRILQVAKDMKEPVLVHVKTQKGRGYPYAELHPSKFHGVGAFNPDSGEVGKSGCQTFSEAFGSEMIALANQDNRVCAITAAMPGGTGLLDFRKQFPNRLFDVGIAEEHAVSMAGGLAKQGMIPVVALYSTFLQRSFDQLMQDIALLQNHVVFAVDRAGLVGEDGETHHGVFDVGFLRQVPGMTILCPGSCAELKDMLRYSVLEHSGPIAVRYPRGGDRADIPNVWQMNGGRVFCHRQGEDVAILTYGTLVDNGLQAAELLANSNVKASVVRLLQIQPLPMAEIVENLGNCKKVFVLEETGKYSGIWEEVSASLHNILPDVKVYALNLGENFVSHGKVDALYASCGLDGASICDRVLEECRNEN